MGKQPVGGQKKTKEQIASAASNSKKGGKKKWTKGVNKTKVNNAVFLEKAGFDNISKKIGKMKLVTIATVTNSFQINSAIARRVIRHFKAEGELTPIGISNSKTYLYAGKDFVRKEE